MVIQVRMCHDWFRTDYLRLNLHLIIEIFCIFVEELNLLLWETEIISNFVLPLIRILYIFENAMLAHHRSDESQYTLLYRV